MRESEELRNAEARVETAREVLRSAKARVDAARTELQAALVARNEAVVAERDARHAVLYAEFQRTGDWSLVPKCEWIHIGTDKDDPSRSCGKIATRHGACEPADSYCCDEHKCRHKCPELPWAMEVRAKE